MNDLRSKEKAPARTYIILSIAVFLLLVFYAFKHIIEFDEAWTYVSVKNESVPDLLAYRHYNIANNHILNSLWFKLLQALGAKNIFFYRCASLGLFAFYATMLYKMASYHVPSWNNRSDWFLALFFLPPVIFFFATGRGYGMATAFFCGSFYYMKVYLEEKKQGAYWKFLFFGLLCSLSIISFFFLFIAMFIFQFLKTRPGKLLTAPNIISGLLITATGLYIYHIGKIILLHDTLINGTDNLFRYGMYSTFFGSMGLFNLVFPSRDLYDHLQLGFWSKTLVLITFIPVALILIRKGFGKYVELMIVLIVTLLFLGSHLLLHSKYPSDRSVVYLYFLIYIPVILLIIKDRNIFLRVNFYLVALIGIINFFGYFYELSRPDLYTTLQQAPMRQYTIYSDWPNWGDSVMNEFSFNGRLHFVYLAKSFETDTVLTDKKIKAATTDPQTDYILLQRETYLRDRQFFIDGFVVKPLLSSAAKELYLMQRTPR